MFQDVRVRIAARACLAGVFVAAGNLQGNLPFDYGDIFPAVLAFLVGVNLWITTGTFTPLEPHLNVTEKERV